MPQSTIYIWVHVVWSPKNREPILIPEIRGPLFLTMKEIAQEKGYFIDTINGLDDHLHLLIKMNSDHSIGKIIKDLKGASSRWINEHQMVPGGFQWQRGYGAFSVSPWMVPSVKKYILDQ